ncbi:unnamed protein product [Rotaria magnacalcarata]|uniref:HAT C-terminal dimerisation domain-containing protein n=2 Tax=Rotaria magnacalcarata TaxID=392030 RepID=A0A819N786_9BILA|nr:unnamed protein product [Rotaria magnacalcarata]CAF3991304.1 unnamed protein product [Rotaria magnacalcarata]
MKISMIEFIGDELTNRSEALAIFGIIEIDQITFDQIERCVTILKIEVDRDKLFDELINVQSTFKEIISYRESLSDQIKKYIGISEFNCDKIEETDEECEEFIHKSSTPAPDHQQNNSRVRPDQLWAYFLSKISPYCEELKKLLCFVYSIPCSNAFTEGVFNHMKHAWTPSRNSMSIEAIASELKIRMNGKMNCDEFFSYVQNERELIQCARGTQKYKFKKSS